MGKDTETVESVKTSTYNKEQLLLSAKYRDSRDLLSAILEDGKRYSIKEVDKMIQDFGKKEVK